MCVMVVATLASYAAADCTQYDPEICQGLTNGVFVGSNLDCSGWVQCHLNEIHTCGVCPDGLYFDTPLQRCTYSSLVTCTVPQPELICTPGLINRVPVPDSCSLYYQCLGQGDPIQHSCAEALHFDEVTENCDFIDNVRCMREPVVVECPATSEPFSYVPHPWLCDRFFICINGESFERTCFEGTHFDPTVDQCLPIDQAQCTLED